MSHGMVNRCVCFDVRFDVLKAHADRQRCTFDDLQQKFSCGRGCGMCIPYIRLMLETGRTAFDPLLPAQEGNRSLNRPYDGGP